MAYGCELTQEQMVQYIHFNRLHNTMLIKHKINELGTEMETQIANQIEEIKTEIEKHHSATTTATTTTTATATTTTGPVVMLRRKQVGNPADYFDKTFAEYQQGFEANGES